MPFLPLIALCLAGTAQTQPVYVRDLSKPAPLLPQTQPFVQYTRPAYDFNISSDEAAELKIEGKRPKQWWSGELNGMKVGGPILVAETQFGSEISLLRAAYGMRLWGRQINDFGWMDKADRMARLFLSQAGEKTPVAFNFRTNKPTFGSMADGGYASAVWLGRYLRDFPEVDFTDKAKAFILRAETAALAESEPPTDALWLLADRWGKKDLLTEGRSEEVKRRFEAQSWKLDDPKSFRVFAALIQGDGVTGDNNYAMNVLRHEFAPRTGIANGVVLDGYVYDKDHPELWQDGAIALLQMAAWLDNQAAFERAAKMVRATLTDFSSPGLVANGLAAPRGLPDGRAVNGNFGRSHDPVYKGFASGEGHTLATLAMAQKVAGSVYYSNEDSGWAAGVDGIIVIDRKPYSGLSLNPSSYDSLFPAYKKVSFAPHKPAEKIGQPPLMNTVREIVTEYRDNQTVVVARLNPVEFTSAPEPSGVFILADGTRMPANPGPSGFEVPVIASDLAGPISFEGSLGGSPLKAVGARVSMAPQFGSAATWTAIGPMGQAFSSGGVSTKSTQAWGDLRSMPFSSPHKALTFTWSGKGDVSVELWDVNAGNIIRKTSAATERETTTTWDLTALANRRLQVRVVDDSPAGWIAVRDFKLK